MKNKKALRKGMATVYGSEELERKITPEILRETFRYDPSTGVFYWKIDRPFGSIKAGQVVKGSLWSNKSRDYPSLIVRGIQVRAHRAAFAIMNGRWPKQIDHINGNLGDNRWANLRECEHWQNSFNKASRKPPRAVFRGVLLRWGKYNARIQARGRYFWLGSFDSPEEAARAYDLAAIRHHGEFARLNFPDRRADYKKEIMGAA